jgi:glutamine synthetase
VAATELEFYLLAGNSEQPTPRVANIPGTNQPQDGPQYGVMEDIEEVDKFMAELFDVCAAQNIPAGATLKEFSPGQFEVNLQHVASAERACDHAVLLKRGESRRPSSRHARQLHGQAVRGVGGVQPARARQSRGSGGTQRVHGQGQGPAFSETFRHAVGGLAALMAESMAIFAPTANSYRRFRPNMFVPLAPNWGYNHRGVSLRMPISAPEDTRVEHRPGGADGNPYLVLSCILAGLHHGIVNKLDPGPMVKSGEVLEEKILLPTRWDAALDAFEASTVLPEYLDQRYHKLYATCRREECERFHAEISNRDYEWYLRVI